jgi:hypothetical protein
MLSRKGFHVDKNMAEKLISMMEQAESKLLPFTSIPEITAKS